MDFDEILHLYNEGIFTEIETFNSLQKIFNSDNIENTIIPEGLLHLARKYELGLTSKTFNKTKWDWTIQKIIEYVSLNPGKDAFKNTDNYFDEVLQVVIEKNTKYKTKRDFKVTVVVKFKAPFSSSFEIILNKDMEIITIKETFIKERNALCVPMEYGTLQKMFIPEEYRKDKYYAGYFLVVDIKNIEENCDKVKSG